MGANPQPKSSTRNSQRPVKAQTLEDFEIEPIAERFATWWVGDEMTAPLVEIGVKPDPAKLPEHPAPHVVEPGMDPEEIIDSQLAALDAYVYLAESIPRLQANVGPDLTATPWGIGLERGEHTSWAHPIIGDIEIWENLLQRPFDFDNRWWRLIEDLLRIGLEKRGRALVELPDLHGNFDILASVRGPEEVCMDLMDDPDLVRRAGQRAAELYRQCFRRSWEILSAKQRYSISWLGYVHPGPAYIPSSDFWCLTNGETARDMVLPLIREEMKDLERSIFHLDGPDALRHLDVLLELPELNAVQWVFGAGQDPAARWIETYRKIQAAGKGFLVHADNPRDALEVFEALGPQGMWLTVGGFDDADQAQAFLKQVGR